MATTPTRPALVEVVGRSRTSRFQRPFLDFARCRLLDACGVQFDTWCDVIDVLLDVLRNVIATPR